jgi:hypothetical protein
MDKEVFKGAVERLSHLVHSHRDNEQRLTKVCAPVLDQTFFTRRIWMQGREILITARVTDIGEDD